MQAVHRAPQEQAYDERDPQHAGTNGISGNPVKGSRQSFRTRLRLLFVIVIAEK